MSDCTIAYASAHTTRTLIFWSRKSQSNCSSALGTATAITGKSRAAAIAVHRDPIVNGAANASTAPMAFGDAAARQSATDDQSDVNVIASAAAVMRAGGPVNATAAK